MQVDLSRQLALRLWKIGKYRIIGFKLEQLENFKIQTKGKDSSSGDSYQINTFFF